MKKSKLTLVCLDGCGKISKNRARKLNYSLLHLQTVINSEEFMEKILNFSWNNKKQFCDNNGYTNEEIYKIIMEGAEKLLDFVNYEWNLIIDIQKTNKWARRFMSARAFTYKNTLKMTFRDFYFDKMTVAEIMGVIAHEQMHNLGFGHDYNRTVRRNYSVPYGVGSIVTDLARQMGV